MPKKPCWSALLRYASRCKRTCTGGNLTFEGTHFEPPSGTRLRAANQRNVRSGSKADMCGAQAHVRFTPESDIKCDIMESRVRFNLEIGLPPIIAIIESYTSRRCSPALKRYWRASSDERPAANPVNELVNHPRQKICFGIAAIDGHYARVVRAFDHNSPPAFAWPRDRQASPKYAGISAHAYLAV